MRAMVEEKIRMPRADFQGLCTDLGLIKLRNVGHFEVITRSLASIFAHARDSHGPQQQYDALFWIP